MKRKDWQPINRRDFLVSTATLAGMGLPAAGWASSRPCPPSTLSVTGGGATSASCSAASGQLPVLTLSSAAPSGTYPWTFGQAFRKGDVPGGSYITGDANAFQAEVRNRWSDGSVKFAVLSGISAFTQHQPRAVALTTSNSTTSGSNVSEPTSLDVSVAFSGAVSGTVSLQSVLGVDKESWGSGSTGGRVRKMLGPVMSEFHYYLPTNDAHVTVWFFVRRYVTGATEVETVVENGWLSVPAPGQKDYTVSVRVAGRTTFGPAALSHRHHTRWSRVDWIGVDPLISPVHDGAYLRSTTLVPNYTTSQGAPSDATLDSLVQSAAPFAQAGWPAGMGTAGSGGRILNHWDALYVTSGDARAYRSAIVNSQAAGRYGIHYRDEKTGKPPAYASYPSVAYGANPGISDCGSGLTTLPANAGSAPPNYAKSHALPFGFLPYLVTGRHSFREQVEFQAQVSFFASTHTSAFEGMRIPKPAAGAFTTRGFAWAIRSFAAAVCAVPDDDELAGQYRNQLGKTLAWAHDSFVGNNNLGVVYGYSSYDSTKTAYSNFMEDSLTMAVGYAAQVAADSLTGADKTRAQAFALWRMKHIVGRMGGQGEDQYCYRDAATYTCAVAPTNLQGQPIDAFNRGLYSSWGQVYANQFGENTCNASTALNGGSGGAPGILSTDPYPYWGLVHVAIAYAVDLEAPGAFQAWQRLVNASNYSPQNFNNRPEWGVVPR